MIGIIDFGINNGKSIVYALQKIRVRSTIISNQDTKLPDCDGIIMPGVGSFDRGISNLRKLPLFKLIEWRVLNDNLPILGICLGMQLFGQGSEEGGISGLSWVPFDCVRLDDKDGRVPNMGWSTVITERPSKLFPNERENSERYYFTHSYAMRDEFQDFIIGRAHNSHRAVAAFQLNNITGVQFHPEKSGHYGTELLARWVASLCKERGSYV